MRRSGLARAQALYRGRDERARALKAEGKPVLGYLCYFAPPEIIEAAGFVPYRIRGDIHERITLAEQYVEPYGCPFVRNTFDLAMKDRYDFLDGIVMSHACDSVQRMYGIWSRYKPAALTHMVNVPHVVSAASEKFFRRELEMFKEKLEGFTGQAIDPARLREAVDLYNRNRGLIRRLYDLRRQDPPLISGTEMLELLIATTTMPAVEVEELLSEVLSEVAARSPGPRKPRLLFYGCINDDTTLVRLLEECSSSVVMDDTCIGARGLLGAVVPDGDVMSGFVRYYFRDFQCPRTYRGEHGGRFDYLVQAAGEFDVDGVVIYLLSFCDPHKFDVVDVQARLEDAGLPCLVLEDDYTFANLESIRTRIQAFVEIIA